MAMKTLSAHALQQTLFATNHTQNAVGTARPSNPVAFPVLRPGFASLLRSTYLRQRRKLENHVRDLRLKANQIVNAGFLILFSILCIKS